MVQKAEFGIFPNEPRRFWDEVIASYLFGWRWLPYTTSRPRKCWVFCSPSVRRLDGLPGGQFLGPTSGAECEIKPDLERIAYGDGLPEFTNWFGLSASPLTSRSLTNLRPAVRYAINSAREYTMSCPEPLRIQAWHPSYPALVIPVRKGFKVAIHDGNTYVTQKRNFSTRPAAVNFAEKAAGGEVDVCNGKLVRVKSLTRWRLP